MVSLIALGRVFGVALPVCPLGVSFGACLRLGVGLAADLGKPDQADQADQGGTRRQSDHRPPAALGSVNHR